LAGVETNRCSEDIIAISLSSSCVLRFRRKQGTGWPRAAKDVRYRSAHLLRDQSRRDREHRVPPVDLLRHSVTFRNFMEGDTRNQSHGLYHRSMPFIPRAIQGQDRADRADCANEPGRREGEQRPTPRTQCRKRRVTDAASPQIEGAGVAKAPNLDRVRPLAGARCGKPHAGIWAGVVSGRRESAMLYGRWRWTHRSRFVGGGFKRP
jgi:hypothetical protein